MITEVVIQPNPFSSAFNLEITSEQNKHAIIRLFNPEDRIIKMLAWYLLKGTNITKIEEIKPGSPGICKLDIIDNEGKELFAMDVLKEE